MKKILLLSTLLLMSISLFSGIKLAQAGGAEFYSCKAKCSQRVVNCQRACGGPNKTECLLQCNAEGRECENGCSSYLTN